MRLLIATGGSPHSDLALRLGAQIALRTSKIPTVLTVIAHKADEPRAKAILERARELLGAEVSEMRTKIRIGQPVEEIIREAEESSYELIILGERGDHDLVTRLLGSTAKRIVEHAPCPVIIAKGKIGAIRRILLCDSGAESSVLLSRFTTRLVNLLRDDVQVTILHVMSQMTAGPGVRGKQLRASTEELIQERTPEGELLEQDVHIMEQLDLHPSPKVRHGFVVDEILDEARSGDYDLVVIGAHREEGWQRFLLDDLAHQIMVQMDRPVLVVR